MPQTTGNTHHPDHISSLQALARLGADHAYRFDDLCVDNRRKTRRRSSPYHTERSERFPSADRFRLNHPAES